MANFDLPDFASATPESLVARIKELVARQEAEVDALAAATEPATIDSLLAPFEASFGELTTATNVLWTFTSSVGGEAWDAADAEVTPLLAQHDDAIFMNSALYARFEELAATDGLDAESARAVEEHLKHFRASGAQLAPDGQAQLKALNARMSELETEISQRIVAAGISGAVAFDEEETRGLSDTQKAGLAASAQAHPELAGGKPYLSMLSLPTQQPLLKSLADSAARARLLQASVTRGDGHDEHTDTRAFILEILRARAQAASLLGFKNYAEFVASQAMAGSSSAIDAFLKQMVEPTNRNVTAEADELKRAYEADGGAAFTPADWGFAAERVRAERFSGDEAALAPYFELTSVVENGVFFAAHELYGLTFEPRPDVRGWGEDVRAWQVNDADGTALGLFLGDYYARAGKHGGAWMHAIVERSGEGHAATVVANNLNLPKPPAGQPTLLSWDEVNTAFHEFGHALHALLSDVRWPSLAGTDVARDLVEYPSQVNEVWAAHPRVLAHYAKHVETGEVIPVQLVDSLQAASTFGAGQHMSELLQAVLLDQAWHHLAVDEVPEEVEDVAGFEERALRSAGVLQPLVPPRYRTTYYAHIFGAGYAAGYYSYLWSEALDADTVEWFRHEAAQGDDLGLNREAGATLRREVLSRGNSRDPKESFRALRGRDVDVTPLMRRNALL